jgi:hypothetical protein
MKIWLIVLAMLSQAPSPSFPQAEISNSRIRATIHLPSAERGYYRGTRFDWSGAISSLTWNGHEYFGVWFEKHDPKIHDAITGPVEEFLTGDAGLGYAEAAVGGTFVRIGVGVLRKPNEPAFRRFETYEIVDSGKWTVNRGSDTIEFVHELSEPSGYAYVYRKRLRLVRDSLVIEHRLRNTGKKPIATTVYNHNFFTIDRRTTGPDLAVRFGFVPRAMRPLNDLAEVRGNEVAFLKEFQPKQTLFTEIEGFGATAKDYDFRLENRATGAGVHITGDRPLVKVYFWTAEKTSCPEPYIDVSAEPGKESSWTTTYDFYKTSSRK